MGVAVRTDREGDRVSIVLTGPFDLAHAPAVAEGVESAEACLGGCGSVEVDLSQLDGIDGAGAVLIADLLDRLDANKCRHAHSRRPRHQRGTLDRPLSRASRGSSNASEIRDEFSGSDRRVCS